MVENDWLFKYLFLNAPLILPLGFLCLIDTTDKPISVFSCVLNFLNNFELKQISQLNKVGN